MFNSSFHFFKLLDKRLIIKLQNIPPRPDQWRPDVNLNYRLPFPQNPLHNKTHLMKQILIVAMLVTLSPIYPSTPVIILTEPRHVCEVKLARVTSWFSSLSTKYEWVTVNCVSVPNTWWDAGIYRQEFVLSTQEILIQLSKCLFRKATREWQTQMDDIKMHLEVWCT